LLWTDGRVTDWYYNPICSSGGKTCLLSAIEANSTKQVTASILDNNYTFNVYPNGTAEDQASGLIVCTSGGTACLTSWVNDNTPNEYTISYGGKSYRFYIYNSTGVVKTIPEMNTVCMIGGKTCLTNYVNKFIKKTEKYT
jgi:hypothetical protein